MLPNFLVLIAASFIPFVFGYIWFHDKAFGGETWYNLANLSGANRVPTGKGKVFATLILNFLIANGLFALTVHQFGAFGMVGGDASLLHQGSGAAFMADYGSSHLDFGHGMVHAIVAILTFIVPLIGYVTLFEHKSFKYFLVYLGYWFISLSLMSGVINVWGGIPA